MECETQISGTFTKDLDGRQESFSIEFLRTGICEIDELKRQQLLQPFSSHIVRITLNSEGNREKHGAQV